MKKLVTIKVAVTATIEVDESVSLSDIRNGMVVVKYTHDKGPVVQMQTLEPEDIDISIQTIVSSDDVWNEFYRTGGKLGQSIKNMPVNRTTEPILNKLNDFIDKNGYLSETVAFDLLTGIELHYLNKMFIKQVDI